MEFFQELIFTAFLALILSFLVAKIVSFAVSNSTTDANTVVCSVDEVAVAKEVALDGELRVRSSKGQNRVKFVDDVVIRRIDRYEGSENLVLPDDVGSVGGVIVEEKRVDEKFEERADEFGENGLTEESGARKSEERCLDVREMHDADAEIDGCEKVEMLIGKEGDGDGDDMDRVVSEKETQSVIVEELKIGVELEGDDTINDGREGNGVVGSGEREGLVTGDAEEEEKTRDESDGDDGWEGIERSELEKVFAGAVNYVEYGGKAKDKEDDHLAKLSSDVQMQLYGLHKVAVEGPCSEPQPMAIKLSARAKWNAWQRLGSMSQESAMEEYIRVLSDSIPGWMHDNSADDIGRKLETVGNISDAEHGRKPGLSATPIGDSSTGQSSVVKVTAVQAVIHTASEYLTTFNKRF